MSKKKREERKARRQAKGKTRIIIDEAVNIPTPTIHMAVDPAFGAMGKTGITFFRTDANGNTTIIN